MSLIMDADSFISMIVVSYVLAGLVPRIASYSQWPVDVATKEPFNLAYTTHTLHIGPRLQLRLYLVSYQPQ